MAPPGNDDFWQRVMATVDSLDRYNYYQLLGVERDASADDIREIYFRMARAIHPDRHVTETDPVRQAALVKAYARLSEAYRTLVDTEKRARYDAGLGEGKPRAEPAAPTRGGRLVDARDPRTEPCRQLLAKAEGLLASGERAKARAQLDLARQLEPASVAIAAAIARLEASERRAQERQEPTGRIEVTCATWEQYEAVYVRDLSTGGMFVRSRNPLEVGSVFDMALRLPDGGTIPLRARVKHTVPADSGKPPGFGVEFLDVDARRLAVLERLLPRKPADALPTGIEDEHTSPLLGTGTSAPTPRKAAIAAMTAHAYDEALILLAGELDANPDDRALRALHHLASGHVAKASGKRDRAIAEMEAALKCDATLTEAAEELRRLKSSGKV